MIIHFSLGRNKGIACGIHKYKQSMQITSVINPHGVTCKRCLRMPAFKEAMEKHG